MISLLRECVCLWERKSEQEMQPRRREIAKKGIKVRFHLKSTWIRVSKPTADYTRNQSATSKIHFACALREMPNNARSGRSQANQTMHSWLHRFNATTNTHTHTIITNSFKMFRLLLFLWKTWADRCIFSRLFDFAYEKFDFIKHTLFLTIIFNCDYFMLLFSFENDYYGLFRLQIERVHVLQLKTRTESSK